MNKLAWVLENIKQHWKTERKNKQTNMTLKLMVPQLNGYIYTYGSSILDVALINILLYTEKQFKIADSVCVCLLECFPPLL